MKNESCSRVLNVSVYTGKYTVQYCMDKLRIPTLARLEFNIRINIGGAR